MSFAADFVNRVHHLERILKSAAIFEDGKHDTQLFAGKKVLLADPALPYDEKRLAFGNAEPSHFSQDRRRTRDRLRSPSPSASQRIFCSANCRFDMFLIIWSSERWSEQKQTRKD